MCAWNFLKFKLLDKLIIEKIMRGSVIHKNTNTLSIDSAMHASYEVHVD